MAPLIRLSGVRKAYTNGTVAIRDLSLEVRQGEFLSILGPSGCGKSTILRMIARLGAPSSGTVELAADRLGFVFQEPTLMPWAKVGANVTLPLRLKGTPDGEARARALEALAMVGLEGAAELYPRELSGGMKMRVSIARALVTRPAVLLMDEPFAALDEITRLKLNNDLLALWQGQGWTVVFVTHSVYESVYLSSRIAVMTGRPGRVADEIAIDAPYPRDEDFRTSPGYNASCRRVSAALQAAMAT